ncbi:MAG: hypothetical protein ACREQX_08365, partial [Candidatus Binataceae bacterium]
LPKYAEGKIIPADEHARDLRRVVAALKAVTCDRAAALVEAVFEFPFLRARNAASATIAFKKLADTEFETETTRLLFEGNPDIWFVDDDFSKDAFAHVEDWGIVSTRISPCAIGAQGDVPLQNTRGWHKRGLDGFDSRCDITGLAHTLKTITTAKARCLWNEILHGHSRHIRGVVESSSRQDYRDSEKTIELSTTGRLITKSSWLPGPDGKLLQPGDLTLDELPEDFIRNSDLARFLGMKPTIPSNLDKESLFRAAGLMPEAARFAKENTDLIERLAKRPDLLEQIREKLEESTDNVQHEAKPLDYRAEIAETFSREAREGADDTDGSATTGPVPNPERRRQKLQEEIQEAKGREPRLVERFTRVLRKVWESKNGVVRTFLEEQYQGRCQICDFTFPERNGDRYFEGVYVVSRTRARWIDRAGNVLCLCANCSAKFVHGEVLADDLLDQIDGFRPSKEGGPISPMLHIVLCGQPTDIRFTERHLLDLQQLVKASDHLADPLIETAEKLA